MEKIRTLIVDDETHGRARIRQLLAGEADFEIVGECANGRQALAAMTKDTPDLVFLDVQMPRLDGFAVCRALPAGTAPLIVFVTAYDRYALQAFEMHAIDYLLKPFDRERFARTLQHARGQFRRRSDSGAQLEALLAEMSPRKKRGLERLAFKADGKVVILRVEEIDWIEAEGNYLKLHTAAGSHLFRETLSNLEEQLPDDKFLRINRSTLVHLDRIKEMQSLFYGDFAVVLRDGTKLTLSRNYRSRVERVLMR